MHKSIRQMAEEVRRKGHGDDKILAHIDPMEAQMLGRMSGGSVNPQTGLPQYGFKKFFRSVERGVRHTIKPLVKAAGPALASAAMMAVGLPPVASLAGAAAIGASQRGKGNKLTGALGGLGQGLMYQSIAPTLASNAGFASDSMIGRMAGLNQPSLLHSLGMSSAPAYGGGIGLFGNMGQRGMGDNLLSSIMPTGLGGLFGNQQGGGSSFQGENGMLLGDLNQIVPVGMRGLGGLFGNQGGLGGMIGNFMRQKQMQDMPQYNPTGQEMMQWGPPPSQQEGGGHPFVSREPQGAENQWKNPNVNRASGLSNFPMMGGASKSLFDVSKEKGADNSPDITKKKKKKRMPKEEQEEEEQYRYYATGGHVKGPGGGVDDKIKKTLPNGTYVVRASDVSMLGDGSTEAGVKKLKKFEDSFIKSGITKSFDDHTKGIKAFVSNGEYTIRPQVVSHLGKGDNDRGAKVMDKITSNLRKHKGIQNRLPPKAKSIQSYMQGGR
jgi:hypothetical protein